MLKTTLIGMPSTSKRGDELEIHYRHVIEELGKELGLLGVIYRKSQNKIQDPAKLERLIKLSMKKHGWD